jgi:hypothetical protein
MIADLCVAMTITISLRGPASRGGYRGMGSHELVVEDDIMIMSQLWNKDTVTDYLPPTTALPSTMLAHHDEKGWHTVTKHAFAAPLHALVRFSDSVAAPSEDILWQTLNCVGVRGALSASSVRGAQIPA